MIYWWRSFFTLCTLTLLCVPLLVVPLVAKQEVTFELWWSGAWHEVLLKADPITTTVGRLSEDDDTPPQTMVVKIDDPMQRFNTRNARSDLYGLVGRNTPGRLAVGGEYRFAGEAASWLPRRTVEYDVAAVLAGGTSAKGAAWVEVTFAGVLRRMGAGEPPAFSAERRAVLEYEPAAYWPLEDGQDAQAAASAVAGVPAMRPPGTSQYQAPVSGAALPPAGLPRFGQGLSPAGSLPGLSLTDGGRLDGSVPPSTAGNWEVHWDMAFGLNASSGIASSEPLWITSADGGIDTWVISVDAAQVTVFGMQGGGLAGTPVLTLVAPAAPYDGVAHHYALVCDDNGAQVDAWLYVDGVQVDLGSVGATEFFPVSGVVLNPIESAGGHDPIGFSHLAVFQPLLPGGTERETVAWAAHGHVGEPAGERIARLADWAGITLHNTGSLSDTEPMGPQPVASDVALLAECARTDMGILHELADQVGLLYRTRESLIGQGASMTLDYTAVGIAPGLEPDEDDRGSANDITTRRPADGATARATLETGGRLAVDAIGRVRRAPEVNVAGDGQLSAQAGWRLHLGTWDEARYPRVAVDLDAADTLVGPVETITPGDLIVIENLEHADVVLMVQGWSERLNTHRRLIDFNCTPALPWTVAEVDATFVGSDGSTLAADLDAGTDTSMSVAVAAGYPLWSGADAPFDVLVGGVVLTVTAVAGASSPQTFTVTATPVNGVVKTVTAGAMVDVWPGGYIGM
jgi:hypothetical protein